MTAPADAGNHLPVGWIDALETSFCVLAALVRDEPVAARWAQPSVLPGYTVGGIAGHVLSLATGLIDRLDAPPSDATAIPYADWYGAALGSAEHPELVAMGEELAQPGPGAVADRLERAAAELSARLRAATTDVVVPLRSIPGRGAALPDFVRTRFVEVLVHTDDVASSAGVAVPDFPAAAYTLAAEVLRETAGRTDPDPRALVRAARRPSAAPGPAQQRGRGSGSHGP